MQRSILATFILSLTLLTASMAGAATEAPIDLILSPPEGMKATKALVNFPHSKHDAAKIECVTCHHTWDGQAEVKKCGTAGCHDQPGKKGENSFYAAYHAKKSDASCLGCHKTLKMEGKEVPTSCKSCHPK